MAIHFVGYTTLGVHSIALAWYGSAWASVRRQTPVRLPMSGSRFQPRVGFLELTPQMECAGLSPAESLANPGRKALLPYGGLGNWDHRFVSSSPQRRRNRPHVEIVAFSERREPEVQLIVVQ